MSGAAPSRRGLTQAEAAMLWAAATLGAPATLWTGLGEEVANDLCQRHEALDALDASTREELLAQWCVEDRLAEDAGVSWARASEAERLSHGRRLDPRWQRLLSAGLRAEGGEGPASVSDVGVRGALMRLAARELVWAAAHQREELRCGGATRELDPGWFCDVSPGRHAQVLMRVGIFELVESLRAHDRRDLARLLRELPEPLRDWAAADLRRERALEPPERARVAEVFVVFSRRHARWEDRALHAGLYFVAAAAGRRLFERLSCLESRLAGSYWLALRRYHRSILSSSRRGLAPAVRRSLWLVREELEALAR